MTHLYPAIKIRYIIRLHVSRPQNKVLMFFCLSLSFRLNLAHHPVTLNAMWVHSAALAVAECATVKEVFNFQLGSNAKLSYVSGTGITL